MKLPFETEEGIFIAHYSERGLAQLDFPAGDKTRAPSIAVEIPAQVKHWHQLTVKALTETLAGREPRAFPPLDLTVGTEFQQQVWNALLRITAGRTQSYAEVASSIGKPKAVRAVGGACGANPIPVLVPCHRVLAANNKLGGFTSGLKWKRILLAREGAGDFNLAAA